MQYQERQERQERQHQQPNNQDLYIPTMVTGKVVLPFTAIGRNIRNILEQHLAHAHEGRCNAEGYVRPRSTQLLAHSPGNLTDRGAVVFEVMYEYQSCNPVEGMLIACVVQTVSQAGLHAHIVPEPSPVVVFVSRDHHYSNATFSKIKPGDEITVRVIGRHFELNDPTVSVIAELH
jgi:DNA-directed RNA polymerase subunit E'/Rpb7|uniref:S1 motif domain-containing protein n=1 Tax=viral metagenome TaxID=1070528 RepID=A0A6C0M143_9ZZZZ